MATNEMIKKIEELQELEAYIEEVKAEMPPTRINVVAFCRETLKSMKPIAAKQQIQLALNTDSPSILMETEVLRLDSILSVVIQNMWLFALEMYLVPTVQSFHCLRSRLQRAALSH